MQISWKTALLASSVGLALTAATSAVAQDANATSQTASKAAPSAIGDIVVTARRRAESLQKVPVAITALTGDQLEQKGVKSVEDLRSLSPSLNISGQARTNASFYLRGQGPGVIQAGLHSFTSVATYFAEVPTTIAGPTTFYDLANVQVLKGPQGTLFGRNTTGGAVLFEPNRPTQRIEGYIQASVGNHDFRETQWMINAPFIPDVASLRVAGIVSRRQGFTKDVLTGQHMDGRNFEAIRASLLLTPGAGIENLTIVDYGYQHNSGSSEILRAVNPAASFGSVAVPAALAPLLGVPAGTSVNIPLRAGGAVSVECLSAALPGCPSGAFGGAVAGFQAAYNGGNFADPSNGGFALIAPTSELEDALARQQQLGSRKTQIPNRLYARYLNYGVTNKTQIQLTDNLTLKNILSLRVSKRQETADFDGAPFSTITIENLPDPAIPGLGGQEFEEGAKQFTEEFQVQGKLPNLHLNYIVGYYHEIGKPGINQVIPSTQFGSPSYVTPYTHDQSDAVFGHLEWQITDLIGVSGGVRQTWDKRAVSSATYNGNGVCTQIDPVTGLITCPIGYHANFSALTYDGTVNLKPARNLLVYAAYRHGYKSGGFTLPAPAGFQTFKPEFVNDIEIGLKGDWNIGIPIRADIAGFYDKYKDIQISTSAIVGGTVSTVVQNLGKQTNKGVEVELSAVPAHGLTVSGFFSYLRAASDITVPSPLGIPAAVKGRQIGFQPKYKYGVSAAWTLPVHPGDGDIIASADWSWQSVQNTADIEAPLDFWPSYGLLNARLEWKNAFRKGLDLSVFSTNLTDKKYILGGYSLYTALGFEGVLYGEPRMYGATLRWHFGD